MKQRLLKDFRALAPCFFLALAVALGGWIYSRDEPAGDRAGVLSFVFLIQFCLLSLMGVLPFGMEFDHGTWQRLLSFPIGRVRIWREKIGLLASMALVVYAVDAAYFISVFPTPVKYASWFSNPNGFILILTVFLYFSILTLFMGPCTSLYSRQSHVAFWRSLLYTMSTLCALVFPALLLSKSERAQRVLTSILNYFFTQAEAEIFILTLNMIPWCVLVYVLAWRRFKHMEV